MVCCVAIITPDISFQPQRSFFDALIYAIWPIISAFTFQREIIFAKFHFSRVSALFLRDEF